jgi:hypothetical protein
LSVHSGEAARDKGNDLTMKWYYNFIKRWPELHAVKPSGLSELRAKAASSEPTELNFTKLGQDDLFLTAISSIQDGYTTSVNSLFIYIIDKKEKFHRKIQNICLTIPCHVAAVKI